MRDRFLTQISHEARTPLNTIIGTAFLLQQSTLTEQQYQSVVKIIESAKQLLHSIQDMQNFIKVDIESHESVLSPDTAAFSSEPRILLVEDNEINQEIALEIIKSTNIKTDVAQDGQEALDAVEMAMMEKKPYSLIFMDVQMPVMDGLEATKALRTVGYTVPIVAMTAHSSQEGQELSFKAGMNAHLSKPLDATALLAAIAQWLPTPTTQSKPQTTSSVAPPSAKPSSGTQSTSPLSKDTSPVSDAQNILPPRITGFNMRAGLATLGGNEALYKSLLIKFARRYATINEDISASLQNEDIDGAVRLAHTVRGIAANLGAEDLSKAAELLEKSLITDPHAVAPYVETLIELLSEAIEAIEDSFKNNTAHDKGQSTLIPVHEKISSEQIEPVCHALDAAVKNMELDWGHANDVTEEVFRTLYDTALEPTIALLRQAIEDFTPKKAQEHCLELQKFLRNPQ